MKVMGTLKKPGCYWLTSNSYAQSEHFKDLLIFIEFPKQVSRCCLFLKGTNLKLQSSKAEGSQALWCHETYRAEVMDCFYEHRIKKHHKLGRQSIACCFKHEDLLSIPRSHIKSQVC